MFLSRRLILLFSNAASYLEQLIELICRDKKYFICIYDLSDMLKNEALFGLPFIRRFHKADFCGEIKKSTKGAQYCIKCRQHSFLKASKTDCTYIGRCYLGITEIVKPVHIGGRLSAVIYLGNIIHASEYADTLNRIRKHNQKMGINEEILSNALNTIGIVNSDEINECVELVNMLYKSLMFAYTSSLLSDKKPSPSIYKKTSFLTQCIKDYVEEYYATGISVEQLARLYFVNSNYLRNLFKKQTGMNFTDYFNKIRIEKASEMIKNSEKRIIDISMEVGFNNVTYFNRLFKQYKGLSPNKYREL
jgi:AraC-like DNA-binding protein/ligand-binding sensor protein